MVQLGFCVEIDDASHYQVIGHHSTNWDDWDGGFIGGAPSWLVPDTPPQQPFCATCCVPMRFVCQIYAPLDGAAFHRTLYVFGCPNLRTKHTYDGITVLRSQLPRTNDYWPYESQPGTPTVGKACEVCGRAATGKCPQQNKYFCGKTHQKLYKKYSTDEPWNLEIPNLVEKLREIVVEEEPDNDDQAEETPVIQHQQQCIETPGLFENVEDDDSDAELVQSDLNAMVTGEKREQTVDEHTQQLFVDTISRYPSARSQVLRYDRWNNQSILWLRGPLHRPKEIPQCPCGSDRQFEFQLLPNMLQYYSSLVEENCLVDNSVKKAVELSENLIQEAPPEMIAPDLVKAQAKAKKTVRTNLLNDEWGIVVVYTCVESCPGQYHTEYAWRQPPVGM